MIILLLNPGPVVASAEPFLPTDGVIIRGDVVQGSSVVFTRGSNRVPVADRAAILVSATPPANTDTITLKLWGQLNENDTSALGPTKPWYPLGTGATGAALGLLNNGDPIGAQATSGFIRFSQVLNGLSIFRNLYVQVTAVSTAGVISSLLVGLVPLFD